MKKVAVFLLSFLLLFSGIFIGTYNNSDTPYLPTFIDPCDGTVVIEDEEVPLANVTSTTTTKTSKKKSTKKVKMKKAAVKSYTKKLPTKTKTVTKTSTKKTSQADTKTQVVTRTTTAQIEKYTKKSKVKKVTSNITTRVTTTITTTQKSQAKTGSTKVDTSGGVTPKAAIKKDNLNVRTMAPKMDNRVLSAFETLGFTVSADSTVNYSGYFNAGTQQIILRDETDPCIYHELGHFLGFIANNIDRGAEFQAIYAAEKESYTAFNKAYVTQNSSEYFAESVKDYFLENANLKATRPQTYSTIVSALDRITDEQVAKYKKIYSSIWTF